MSQVSQPPYGNRIIDDDVLIENLTYSRTVSTDVLSDEVTVG